MTPREIRNYDWTKASAEAEFLDTKTGLSKDLTVIENLNAWSTMKGWSSNKENLIMALKSVGMDKYADLYISQSSEGLKKRAALARLYLSFINKVDFWILDEPTNELDKTSLVLFKQLISVFLKQNGTIIIASILSFKHILERGLLNYL